MAGRISLVLSALLFAALLLSPLLASCDVYMHNPRGSNDRNCERNENRDNANRLFDSQNNNKGGYACPRAVGGPEVVTPRMYYYAGSELTIEWTAQHGCGSGQDQVDCDIVLQYMCQDTAPGIRDGTPENANDAATDTIPEDGSNDQRFGQHETAEFYAECKSRQRNKGLYIADQNVRNEAIGTRQNPNGDRHGLECPEERDYYPYWHPTPWRDIAVLTTDVSRCPYYQRESQNVKPKGECVYKAGNKPEDGEWPNNEISCLAAGMTWVLNDSMVTGVPPDCLGADWSRVNHLGNVANSGYTANYNWTIPADLESPACVIRIRYNISSNDFQQQDGLDGTPFIDSRSNGRNAPIREDPYVPLFLGNDHVERYLSLRVNTDQLGRTFQDRSYVFAVKQRGDDIPSDAKIYNLNVRGKRGNIVQVYPAVEYDFAPTRLHVEQGDYIHFQWTGSDYNPQRGPNDAEGGPRDPQSGGNPRADRSNLIEMPMLNRVRPMNTSTMLDDNTMFVDDDGDPDVERILHLAYLNQTDCLTLEELLQIQNENDRDFNDRNCFKINTPTPYFDGGVVKMNKQGVFRYMSTRNNNFSNRDQKGAIIVGSSGWNWGWIIFFVLLGLAVLIAIVAACFIIYNNKKAAQKQRASDLDARLLNDM